jgi:hypothetical protein
VPGQKPADPTQRHAQETGPTPDLQHNRPFTPSIETGRGEEIVLKRPDAHIAAPIQIDLGGQVLVAQRTQAVWHLPSRRLSHCLDPEPVKNTALSPHTPARNSSAGRTHHRTSAGQTQTTADCKSRDARGKGARAAQMCRVTCTALSPDVAFCR